MHLAPRFVTLLRSTSSRPGASAVVPLSIAFPTKVARGLSLSTATTSRSVPGIVRSRRPQTCQPSLAPAHKLSFSSSSHALATATTPHSTTTNPAEEESQRHLELGTASLEAGNIEEARTAYLKAIQIFETPTAHFNLGVCYYHEKDTEKAIEAWKQTLRLSPEAADAHTNLASAYVMSSPSRPDLAIDHLKSAAKISPQDAEVQFNLGAVLEACEQLEEALKAYERAQEGGIDRAKENIRNVNAKILAVKFGPKPKGLGEEADASKEGSPAAAATEPGSKA